MQSTFSFGCSQENILSSVTFKASRQEEPKKLEVQKNKFPAILKTRKHNRTANVVVSDSIFSQNLGKGISRPRNQFILARTILSKILLEKEHFGNEEISRMVSMLWAGCPDSFKSYYKYLSVLEELWHERSYPYYNYKPKMPSSKAGDGHHLTNTYEFNAFSGTTIIDSNRRQDVTFDPGLPQSISVSTGSSPSFMSKRETTISASQSVPNKTIKFIMSNKVEGIKKYQTLCSSSINRAPAEPSSTLSKSSIQVNKFKVAKIRKANDKKEATPKRDGRIKLLSGKSAERYDQINPLFYEGKIQNICIEDF